MALVTRKNTGSKDYSKHIAKKTVDTGNFNKPHHFRAGIVALVKFLYFNKTSEPKIRQLTVLRFVHEITFKFKTDLLFQSSTVLPLKEAAEAYMFGVYENTNFRAINCNQKTTPLIKTSHTSDAPDHDKS